MNNKSNLVSILIPVYNREHMVGETIESAINQTYKNIEIIIVDNCSTDNTWQVLEHYAALDNRIRLFKNKQNIGPVRNWLECVKKSSGEYIKFIFSDDWIDSDWIEKSIKPLSNKNIAFSFSPVEILIENKLPIISFNWFLKNTIISSDYYIFLNYFKANAPVSPSCALFRRQDVINNLVPHIENPLKIDFAQHGGGIDLLLFLYTAKQYKNIAYINTTKAHFLGMADSISIKQNLVDSYLYAKILFMNDYHSFSMFFWLKLFLRNSSLLKFLKINITLKDLKSFLFFCKNI